MTTTKERKPNVPLTEEVKEKLRKAPAWIILARIPEENSYQGYVENSFNMSFDKEYVLRYSMTWGDGKAAALEDVVTIQRSHSTWEITVWDVHDENIPVILDIEKWLDANAYNPNTISGVGNKFRARNIPFTMKG